MNDRKKRNPKVRSSQKEKKRKEQFKKKRVYQILKPSLEGLLQTKAGREGGRVRCW